MADEKSNLLKTTGIRHIAHRPRPNVHTQTNCSHNFGKQLSRTPRTPRIYCRKRHLLKPRRRRDANCHLQDALHQSLKLHNLRRLVPNQLLFLIYTRAQITL
jgi:hypothetical protein